MYVLWGNKKKYLSEYLSKCNKVFLFCFFFTDFFFHCTEPFIITLSSSQYDLNDVEMMTSSVRFYFASLQLVLSAIHVAVLKCLPILYQMQIIFYFHWVTLIIKYSLTLSPPAATFVVC